MSSRGQNRAFTPLVFIALFFGALYVLNIYYPASHNATGQAYHASSTPSDNNGFVYPLLSAPLGGSAAQFQSYVLAGNEPVQFRVNNLSVSSIHELQAAFANLKSTGILSAGDVRGDMFTLTLGKGYENSRLVIEPQGIWLTHFSSSYLVEFEDAPLAAVLQPVQETTQDLNEKPAAPQETLPQETPEQPELPQENTPLPEIEQPPPAEQTPAQDSAPAAPVLPSETPEAPSDEPASDAPLTGYVTVNGMSTSSYLQQLHKSQAATISNINDRLKQSGSEALLVEKKYDTVFNGVLTDMSPRQAALVENMPGVKSVHPNVRVQVDLNDSLPIVQAPQLWPLDASGNLCATSGQPCITGKGVIVAIIDTGVDYTHADFGACTTNEFASGACVKVAKGYDFVNHDADPHDDQGHGTHVAAIVAANPLPSVPPDPSLSPYYGVAPGATLYAYKVLDAGGSGYYSDIISGIEQAVTDGVDIISMSLGGRGDPDDPLSVAVDAAAHAGVLSVVAAGNSGPSTQTIGSPGTAREALTVGAVDKLLQLASFSSRGPVVWSGGILAKPDIVAPGVLICAAQLPGAFSGHECADGHHIAISGTSMATPMVSGVAALLKQQNPAMTPSELKSLLASTATDLGYARFEQGSGLVSAQAAFSSPVLINGSLDFGSLSVGQSATQDIVIINRGNTDVIMNLSFSQATDQETGAATDVLSTPSSLFTIPASGQLSVPFTASLAANVDGIYLGTLTLQTGSQTYHLPYAVSRHSALTINVPGSRLPNVFVTRTDGKIFKYASQGWEIIGDQYTFSLPGGDYYAVATSGGVDSEQPLWYDSSEYFFIEEVHVPIGQALSMTFDESKLRPYTFSLLSEQGDDLQVVYSSIVLVGFDGSFGYCSGWDTSSCEQNTGGYSCVWDAVQGTCRDNAFTLGSTSFVPFSKRFHDRVVYVSDKPASLANMSLFMQYNGAPINGGQYG